MIDEIKQIKIMEIQKRLSEVETLKRKMEEAEGEKHFLIQTKLGYEHKIAKHFTLGLRDSFIYKVDCLKNGIDSTQKLNTAQIYVKIVFARD